jgi:hypothetical protein
MADAWLFKTARLKLAGWMAPFSGMFTAPTWQRVLVLLIGAVLSPRRRTVAAALRVTGLDQDPHFTNYHRVLNRGRWSSRRVARCLFCLLVKTFIPSGPVIIGLDDTLERRWGAKIAARGIYRDPTRSSHGHSVKASGLRWLSIMLLPEIAFGSGLGTAVPDRAGALRAIRDTATAAAQEAHGLGTPVAAANSKMASRSPDHWRWRQQLRRHRPAECGAQPGLHDHPPTLGRAPVRSARSAPTWHDRAATRRRSASGQPGRPPGQSEDTLAARQGDRLVWTRRTDRRNHVGHRPVASPWTPRSDPLCDGARPRWRVAAAGLPVH